MNPQFHFWVSPQGIENRVSFTVTKRWNQTVPMNGQRDRENVVYTHMYYIPRGKERNSDVSQQG
jgi:hypothetical protein